MPAAVHARDRRRDATRAEILATAWRLAEDNGVAALSLRELARESGMQPPSLYTYFPSKAAIYDAMFVQGYRRFADDMEAIPVDRDDVQGSLTTAIERFVAFCQASPARYQLLFTRAVPDWAPSEEAYAVSLAQYARASERLAEVGISDQDDRDLWIAVLSGLAAQQLANDPSGDRWRRLAGGAAAMFTAYVQGRETR